MSFGMRSKSFDSTIAIESLEERRLFSWVGVYPANPSSNYSWSNLTGENQDDAATLTINNLPVHTHASAYAETYVNDSFINPAIPLDFEMTLAGESLDIDEWDNRPAQLGWGGSINLMEHAGPAGSSIALVLAGSGFSGDWTWYLQTANVAVFVPVVSIASNGETTEGAGEVELTVSRDGNSTVWDNPLTVTVNIGGDADQGDDFTITSLPVTIPAGEGSTKIKVTTKKDNLIEGDETLTLSLPANGAYGLPHEWWTLRKTA